MKKSEIYKRAQVAVLVAEDWIGGEYNKLEILRELFAAEDLEIYREKQAEKKTETESANETV